MRNQNMQKGPEFWCPTQQTYLANSYLLPPTSMFPTMPNLEQIQDVIKFNNGTPMTAFEAQ